MILKAPAVNETELVNQLIHYNYIRYQQNVQLNQIKYIDVTLSSNTPIQSPRLDYNLHAAIIQLYDHTQHPHSHTSTPIPPMYSTLPTNGDMTSYISSPDSQHTTYVIIFLLPQGNQILIKLN